MRQRVGGVANLYSDATGDKLVMGRWVFYDDNAKRAGRRSGPRGSGGFDGLRHLIVS
jgi:hypothetical protein